MRGEKFWCSRDFTVWSAFTPHNQPARRGHAAQQGASGLSPVLWPVSTPWYSVWFGHCSTFLVSLLGSGHFRDGTSEYCCLLVTEFTLCNPCLIVTADGQEAHSWPITSSPGTRASGAGRACLLSSLIARSKGC